MRILRPEDVTLQDFATLKFGELTPAELHEAFALLRADITSADLEGFKDLDKAFPVEDVLRELEETQIKSRTPD